MPPLREPPQKSPLAIDEFHHFGDGDWPGNEESSVNIPV